jgi:hypothetical protein
MPAASAVFVWLSKHKDFAEQYTRAREAQAEAIFDELFDIADDGQNDWMEIRTESGQLKTVVDHEHISRSKLRIDMRRWALARMSPKKYGEKITQEHTGPDGKPLHMTDAQIAAELNALAQAVPTAEADDGDDLV